MSAKKKIKQIDIPLNGEVISIDEARKAKDDYIKGENNPLFDNSDDINIKEKTAAFGRLIIDHKAAGEGGMGFDATVAACKIGFEQLGLRELHLEVLTDNGKAIRTYQKAGFLLAEQCANLTTMKLNKEDFLLN